MSGDVPGFRCAFCGKTQHEVKALIAAQTEAAICDECVGQSVCILLEKGFDVTIPHGVMRVVKDEKK